MIDKLFNNPTYAMSKAMLDVTTQRHEALAANIANVNMPGYRRVDVSSAFTQELQKQFKDGHVDGAAARQDIIAADPTAISARSDGNNVQLDQELLQMGSNEMQYETLTEFVSDSLAQLKTAIKGQVT